ncbi:MAG: chromate efflux transporter [Deltaproteobacteria bacterium]
MDLPSLLGLALYLGFAGFGGGFSVLAQIRREVVERRRWIEPEPFVELLEVAKVLPGTSATNLFTLLGQRGHGTLGGVLAGATFLLPSAAIMVVLAAFYGELRSLSQLGAFLDGLGIAMVPIIGAVIYDIGKDALRTAADPLVALFCCALMVRWNVGLFELALAAAAIGASAALIRQRRERLLAPPVERHSLPGALLVPFLKGGAGLAALPALGLVFARIGAATFGGGLVMIPAIEQQVVSMRHWMSPGAFADAIAFGQVTPGPVAISATFIGYRVSGLLGALVGTVAMFGPPMLFAILAGRGLSAFRQSAAAKGALRALGPAVIGMLFAALWSLGQDSVGSPGSLAIAFGGLAALLLGRVNPLWILAGGGTVTLGCHLFAPALL